MYFHVLLYWIYYMVIICKCFFLVLNGFVLMFFISNTLSGSFLFTTANPLTVRAKIVISPSINDEFYLGAVRVINIIFITNNNIIVITTISMIISLDVLTGGIKLVGNQGLVILYCNAIQAYQWLIFVLEKKYIIFISSISK